MSRLLLNRPLLWACKPTRFVRHASNSVNKTVENKPKTKLGVLGSTPLSDDQPDVKPETIDQVPKISKKAMKRLKKQQEWEAKKPQWRAAQKAKQKRKREDRQVLIEQGIIPPPIKKPRIKGEDQTPSNMKIVLDMAFDELMTDREIKSIMTQLSRCHSANKHSYHPVEVFATSTEGRIAKRVETIITDAKNWKRFTFDDRPYTEIFPKESLVYLTADSPNKITELDESKAYIIGGIVDKNRHKLLTFKKAEAEGIAHAQLPIGEYIQLSQRKVLAVNHVFEILSHYLDCRDWEKAFREIIPQRKMEDRGKEDGENGESDAASEERADVEDKRPGKSENGEGLTKAVLEEQNQKAAETTTERRET